jgi:hypothetical protein
MANRLEHKRQVALGIAHLWSLTVPSLPVVFCVTVIDKS